MSTSIRVAYRSQTRIIRTTARGERDAVLITSNLEISIEIDLGNIYNYIGNVLSFLFCHENRCSRELASHAYPVCTVIIGATAFDVATNCSTRAVALRAKRRRARDPRKEPVVATRALRATSHFRARSFARSLFA